MSNILTIAYGYILISRGGQKICFTNHDNEIIIDGDIFHPANSLDIGHLEINNGLGADNASAFGGFEIGAITENDLKLGKWAGASIKIIIFNWQNPDDNNLIFSGFVKTINQTGNEFEFEIAGQKSHLDNNIGRSFGRNCDAILGDEKCKVNLENPANYIITTIGNNIDYNHCDYVETLPNPTKFNNGEVVFKTGLLSGFRARIMGLKDGKINFARPLPLLPQPNDEIKIYAGCDKTFENCKAAFGNGDNFRGCPHMPGQTQILNGPIIGSNNGGSRYGG